MVTKLAIIHFQPLELYPPTLNLLEYLDEGRELEVSVYTTASVLKKNIYAYNNILVKRFRNIAQAGNIFIKICSYLSFYIGTFFRLIGKNPQVILYYETESSFPVYLYLLFSRKKLLIHYHEYNDPKWYSNTSKHIAWFRRLEEKFLYRKAIWISQTNETRLQLFLQDIKTYYNSAVHHTLPNYPPRRWITGIREPKNNHQLIKLVYTGTLSFEGSYLDQVVKWVKQNQERISLTLYSYNISLDALRYLQNQVSDNITIRPGGINYHEMPVVLSQYDYGLIIYKTLSSNYLYNIPNKFFEYLACGLGVIFPTGMNLMKPFISQFPEGNIIQVDFDKLNQSTCETLSKYKSNATRVSSPFFCEEVFGPLIEEMKN